MGPNVGFDEDGMGYGGYQQLATYFVIGDADCETYGCTDELASNYDVEATVDDGVSFCDEGSVDVTFAFNQENVTDEVYVYNQETNDLQYDSGEPLESATWAGKRLIILCSCWMLHLFQWGLHHLCWMDRWFLNYKF